MSTQDADLPIANKRNKKKNKKNKSTQGEMGENKDPSDFDKGRIVMARRLGTSISETAKLVDCSLAEVVKIYQQWCEERQGDLQEGGPTGDSCPEDVETQLPQKTEMACDVMDEQH